MKTIYKIRLFWFITIILMFSGMKTLFLISSILCFFILANQFFLMFMHKFSEKNNIIDLCDIFDEKTTK